MADWMDGLRRARGSVQPRWSEARARGVANGIVRKRLRQSRIEASAALAVTLFVAVTAAAAWRNLRPAEPVVVAAAAPTASLPTPSPGADRTVHLADGSTALPLDATSVVEPVESAAERVVVRVPRGGATFQVAHDPSRLFRVEVGPVVVEDLGTSFTVERIDGDARVRVAVAQGLVRVSWADGVADVAAGESGVFPQPAAGAADHGAAVPSATPSVATALPAPAASTRGEQPWQKLARSGDYDRAYDTLEKQGPSTVEDDVGDLLLAADVARLSHHPADALSPLRKVTGGHRTDERAPLAAFTLGRVLLDDLNKPADAAQAFADARALAPDGVLAGDALAREVEARARAGEPDRARTLAEEYVRRYPAGSRVRSVRRFGHLE